MLHQRNLLSALFLVLVAGVLGFELGSDGGLLGLGRVSGVTFLNHSVQGLEIGAPVHARGVPVGHVTKLSFAPDASIQVDFALDRDHTEHLGFASAGTAEALRAKLLPREDQGGFYLDLEQVKSGSPAPALAFDAPPGYVPAAPRHVGFEGTPTDGPITSADMNRRFEQLAESLRKAVEDADVAGVSTSARSVLERIDAAMAELDAPQLSARTQETLDAVERAAVAFAELVEDKAESGGGGGLFSAVSSIGLVADSITGAVEEARVGETMEAVRGSMGDARETVADVRVLSREVQQLLVSIQSDMAGVRAALEATTALLGLIERDPGAILRGRQPNTDFPVEDQ